MAEEIQTLNLNDAAQQLREKIRTAFVELIPKEQWDAMVQAELEAFLKERPNPNYGSFGGDRPRTIPSIFHEIGAEVFKEHVKTLFKAELSKPEWNEQWTGFGQEIGSAVKTWLTENAQPLLQTTLKELFGYQAQQMINRLRSQ